jgi:hypothetical protein
MCLLLLVKLRDPRTRALSCRRTEHANTANTIKHHDRTSRCRVWPLNGFGLARKRHAGRCRSTECNFILWQHMLARLQPWPARRSGGPLPPFHGEQAGRPEQPPGHVRCGEGISPAPRTPGERCRAVSDWSAMAGRSTLSSARRSRHAAGGGSTAAARSPGYLARRRGELEARWRSTLDQVTALSVAYHEALAAHPPDLPAPWAGQAAGASPASPGDQCVSRLAQRVVAERQSLAEIEAALDRIAGGRYGRCELCHRPISARLLSAVPAARFCSACARHSVHLVAGG